MKRNSLVAAAVAAAIATPVVMTHEGNEPRAYLDPVDIPTICYGSTTGVKLGQTKTDAECQALLKAELGHVITQVGSLVMAPLPDTRLAALGSFAYNVGIGNFKRSTLLKRLNAGEGAAACAELSKWVYAKGKKLPGLVTRRDVERALCEWSISTADLQHLVQQVNETVTIPLSSTRRAALAAYAYHIGLDDFRVSPVVQQLSAGSGRRACLTIRTWPAVTSPEMAARRAAQQRMCEVEP